MTLRVLTRELVPDHENFSWPLLASPITDIDILAWSGKLPKKMPDYDIDFRAPVDSQRQEHIIRVRMLMRDPSTWPPIQLMETNDGTVTVDDGHHRLAAAAILELPDIAVKYHGEWSVLRQAFPASYRKQLLRRNLWN